MSRDGKISESGQNIAGQILMALRGNAFPHCLLIGDSLLRGLKIPNAGLFCWPGAHVSDIGAFVNLLACLPVQQIFILCGTNDTVDRDKSLKNPIKVVIKLGRVF